MGANASNMMNVCFCVKNRHTAEPARDQANSSKIKKESNNINYDQNILRQPDHTEMAQNLVRPIPSKQQFKLPHYHQNEIYAIASLQSGNLLASCGADKVIKLFDIMEEKEKGTLSSSKTNSDQKFYDSLAFSQVNPWLLSGTTDNMVEIFDYTSLKLLLKLNGHTNKVTSVDFSYDAEKCVSTSMDRSIKFWDVQNGSVILSFNCSSVAKTIDAFEFEPSVASGHTDGSLRIYSLTDGQVIEEAKGLFEKKITSVSVSRKTSNTILASSQDGNTIKLYERRTGKVLMSYSNDSYYNVHEYNTVCFGPDEKSVIAGTNDGGVIVWNTLTGVKERSLNMGTDSLVITCDYNLGTGYLFAGDKGGNIVAWK